MGDNVYDDVDWEDSSLPAFGRSPLIAFLLVPLGKQRPPADGGAGRADRLVRLGDAFAEPIADAGRMLLAFRRMLLRTTTISMTAGIIAVVAIGLFARRSGRSARPLSIGALLRGLLWLFDLWLERDWRRFGRLDEDGMPVIREMTMKEFAAAAVTSRRRIGSWLRRSVSGANCWRTTSIRILWRR